MDEGLEDVEQSTEVATIFVELFAVDEGKKGLGGVPLDAEVGVCGFLENIGEQLHRSTLLNVFVTADNSGVQHLEHRGTLLLEHGTVGQQDQSLEGR